MMPPYQKDQQTAIQRPPTQRARPFRAPDELPAEHGVQFHSAAHIQGIVEPQHLRGLLDSYGLENRKDITLPFQHIAKSHGEVWSLRVEPAAIHHTADGMVVGHQYQYRQEQPESVAGEQ